MSAHSTSTLVGLIRSSATVQTAVPTAGEVSSHKLTQVHLDHIATTDGAVGAFLDANAEYALGQADAINAARKEGQVTSELTGAPVAVKDLIVARGQVTIAASRTLKGWVSPYDAILVCNLRAVCISILGKTNLDGFAMGGSVEHSAFGRIASPWGLGRIPGGSSGGSAAAVDAYEAPVVVGTDIGGSIRQPAAAVGIVGIKSIYGTISCFSIIVTVSPLGTPGPMACTMLNTALLHDVTVSHDPPGLTSLPGAPRDMVAAIRVVQKGGDLTGLRVSVISELDGGEGYHDGVVASFHTALGLLEAAGAQVETVSLSHLEYALDTYYFIMPVETSSDLTRYDGMRYGLWVEPTSGPVTTETIMAATRGAGSGDEARRRIILGTHALSVGYYDAYYDSAQKACTPMQRDSAVAWDETDILVSSTALVTAYCFGKKDGPLTMCRPDVTMIPTSPAGAIGMSLPSEPSDGGLPVGSQILASQRVDDRLYRVGAALEAVLEETWGAPLLLRMPELEETR